MIFGSLCIQRPTLINYRKDTTFDLPEFLLYMFALMVNIWIESIIRNQVFQVYQYNAALR